jgi:hypothetical protein
MGQVPCIALPSEPQGVHPCRLLTAIFSITGPTDSAHATILAVEIGESLLIVLAYARDAGRRYCLNRARVVQNVCIA